MPRQAMSIGVRFAIWSAHRQVCRYCNEPLTWGELEIDHVIPEAIAKDTKSFQAAQESLGLLCNFDVHSLENLLPAHGRCNRAKSARVFSPQATALFLKLATDAADAVRELVATQKRQQTRDGYLALLADALQSGTLSPTDFEESSEVPRPTALRRPLVFADGIEHSVSAERIEEFLDRPVLIFGDPTAYATFGDAKGERMKVFTCREYRSALESNFFARTTYDMKAEAFLQTVHGVLFALETLRIPTVSYIDRPFCGVADLDLLPPSILPWTSQDEIESIDNMGDISLGDLVRKGEIKILKVSSHEIYLEWEQCFVLRELCRADLDRDGVEDILCERYQWSRLGTLGSGSVLKLSRLGRDDRFTVEIA